MTAASAVRSSLEEMLDSLRRRDQKPKDVPPALPARPPSRARLPSRRRSLPVGINVELKGSEETKESAPPKGDKDVVSKTSIFENKWIANEEQPEESPMPELENYDEKSSKPLPDDKFGCNVITDSVSEKDTNMEHPQVQPSIYAELEKQVSMVEAKLRQTEEENNKMREQLQEYEKRCSENEAKMKSMEEEWKTQVASLQLSLDAAKKSQQSGMNASHVHFNYDSDVPSTETYTPESTPTRVRYMSNGTPAKVSDNPQDPVGYLAKEYEQQKQAFENDVRFLVEMKQGQASPNSDEDLRKLKAQFASWKKDYKVRLRDAKANLNKLGASSNGDKARGKWWILKCMKPGFCNGDKTAHKCWIMKKSMRGKK